MNTSKSLILLFSFNIVFLERKHKKRTLLA
jgi:hypothetical protein